MKILYTGFRDPNHSKYGGYDHIIKYPESDFLDAKTVPFGFIPPFKRGKRINMYFLDIFSRFLRYKYDIIHLFYGDAQILHPYRKLKNNKVVATIHLDIWQRFPKQINLLKKFDAIIVLSKQQCAELRELGINAHFIPYGFNKPIYDFMIPARNNYVFDYSKINIFFSGNNYRDYDTLYYFLDMIKMRNDIVIHVLGQRNNEKQKIACYKNVVIWDWLSDNEYYSLLSLCDYNFLPLTFATGNTALMEAQAIGIRTIVSDVGGVKDYISMENNILFKEKHELKRITDNLRKTPPIDALKEYAQNFYWEHIYLQLEDFYKNLF